MSGRLNLGGWLRQRWVCLDGWVIALQMKEAQDSYFCFTQLSSWPEMYIHGSLTLLSFFFIGAAIRKYCRMRDTGNSHVRCIYSLIFCWWAAFVATGSVAIFVYVVSTGESKTSQEMSDLTTYSFAIAWFNAYLMQLILLYVPYHWGKQINDLFSQAGSKSEIDMEGQEYEGPQPTIYRTLRVYILIRVACLALLPTIFYFRDNLIVFEVLFKVMISCLLADSAVITVSLVIGMYSLKRTRQLREQIDEDESKRMFNQYIMIILANTIRFAFNVIYVLALFDQQFYNPQCPDEKGSQDQISETVISVLTMLLSHYLPVFIILRIYDIEDRPEEMCKSLLITTTD